jgi:hypothetical protein
VFFKVHNLDTLPILLYYLDACHVGFNWICRVYTDCGMSTPTFIVESEVMGNEAYEQANTISDYINKYMDEKVVDLGIPDV